MANPYNYPVEMIEKRFENIETKMSPDYANGTNIDLTVGLVQPVEEDSYFYSYIYRNSSAVVSLRAIVCTADGKQIAPICDYGVQQNGVISGWSKLIKKGAYIKVTDNYNSNRNFITRYPATGGMSKDFRK